MKNNKKIIDKIYKCLRLSESGNPNEAALALRQATSMMKKYGISDAQVLAAEVTESATQEGTRFNPPFWALALANLVAEAFQCRNLISRQYGRCPEFRFIGMGFKAEVATYSYSVLHRYLFRAIEEFALTAGNSTKDESEKQRRTEVFAQAWLFRVGRTVSEFICENADKKVIDSYIQEKYGETAEMVSETPASNQSADYDDILSGMRAANEVALYRSVSQFMKPPLLQHKHAS
ncbi:MAG: DUF2786 domain-containing protein [Gammaproteobacteria bacterium]|nr:DUF2786 domain-containing protein [Gammaproteobacteria bacterium]